MKCRLKHFGAIALTVTAIVAIPALSARAQETQAPNKDAAHQRPAQYLAEFALYRVSGLPIELLNEREADRVARGRIQEVLDNPVGIVFQDIHLKEIVDFVTDTYGINILYDNRVIQPPPGDDRAPANDQTEYVTDGMIPYINLKNVRLGEALKAILRPLGLDFANQGNFIWISTPENLDSETFFRMYSPDDELYIQDAGAINIGGVKMQLGPGEHELILADLTENEHVQLLSKPHALLMAGKETQIRLADPKPVEYFEFEGDGPGGPYFVLRHEENAAELVLTPLIQQVFADAIELRLTVSASYLKGREPLEGTSFDVGRPIFRQTESERTARVRFGHRAVALAPIGKEGEDVLLAVFRIVPWRP